MKNKICTGLWVNYTHNQFVFQRILIWFIGVIYSLSMFEFYLVIGSSMMYAWVAVMFYMVTWCIIEIEKIEEF